MLQLAWNLFRRPPRLLFAPELLLDLLMLVLVSTILLWGLPTLPRHSILQVTFPPNTAKAEEFHRANTLPFPTPAEVRRMRIWQTVRLTGNRQTDSLNLQSFWRKTEHMQQFPNNTTGVAVHFGLQAHYGSLVRAIDYLNQLDVKKYIIDITSPTTTLYAFTDARQQPRPLSIPAPIIVAAAPDPTTSAAARWLQQVGAPLQHPAWGTAILACLGVAVVGAACYVLRQVS